MKKILIIDDEIEMLKSIEKILKQRNQYEIELLQDGQEAINYVQTKPFDIILTDLRIGEISGIKVVQSALSAFPESNVIVISGYGTIESSVEAMKAGAFDFLEKPFSAKKLFDCFDRALSHGAHASKSSAAQADNAKSITGFIYSSDKIQEIIDMVYKIAPGNMNVLITGESGTGKELIARAIHSLSRRLVNPFVPVNCNALPENLFESELFGHERGAFTGAIKTKPGLIEFADQGTFFLDEIGDLSLSLQAKLLRMIEDHKIRRVGGQQEINIDVRIISATNIDLTQAVRDKKFREDLYYRLNTIHIEIPSLRERKEDILPLAYHYLKELSNRNERDISGFSPEAEDILLANDWQGNVRELQNMISRSYYLCSTKIIQKSDLPLPASRHCIEINQQNINLPFKNAKDVILEKFEVEYLTYHLKNNHGNISQTALDCGIDRRSIHRLIKKYNIVYQE